MFQHNFLPRTEITDTTTEAGRVYHTPLGDFDSVTTILGRKLNSSWLDDWKKRVGIEEATRVSNQAKTRGTAIHNLAEKYVMNDPLWARGAMPANVQTFKQLKKVLDERVDVVYGIEYPLYSQLLNTAGRTDLPARFDGVDSIVDYKTSKKLKTRDDIGSYFIQATCYSLMFEERTGMRMPQIVILITVDGEREAQVFIERSKTWYERVRDIFV